MIDFGIYLTYFLVFIALAAAVIMPLISAISDPKSLVKSGMGVGAALVVFLIAYVISGDEVTALYTEFGVDSGSSKLVGGGIIMVYLMAFLAVGGIVFGEVKGMIK